MNTGKPELFRRAIISFMIMALASAMAFADLYSDWSGHADYVMNPAATGIAANQVNFPVLLRLTSADSAAFSSPTSPADLRFAKGANLDVPYSFEVERWDATDKLAEIWVLVDTVFSSASYHCSD